ncbi:hypothetical protein NL676_000496 [Syzygium grande]|nr:hypothetical protein NL676_000496 [Syzygium grande]
MLMISFGVGKDLRSVRIYLPAFDCGFECVKVTIGLKTARFDLLTGRKMAEEHRCQALHLYSNNFSFFRRPATRDLCSKCYLDLQLKEQQSSNAKLAFNWTLTSSSLSSSSSLPLNHPHRFHPGPPNSVVASKAATMASLASGKGSGLRSPCLRSASSGDPRWPQ